MLLRGHAWLAARHGPQAMQRALHIACAGTSVKNCCYRFQTPAKRLTSVMVLEHSSSEDWVEFWAATQPALLQHPTLQ